MVDVFGDIVIYEGNDIIDRVIKSFTGKYTHCAIRTREESAKGIDLWGDISHDLLDPMDCYNSYIIVRHKYITPEKREKLRELHKVTSNDYDLKLLFKILYRKLRKKVPDLEDLSITGKFNCSSRIAKMYVQANLEIGDINHSQMEPYHFLNKYFEIIKEWKR